MPAFEHAAPESRQDVVRIHSGKEKPADAFAAVRYRDHWFWIDDGDWQTKRALTAVMFFFTLAETGGTEKLPLITIPRSSSSRAPRRLPGGTNRPLSVRPCAAADGLVSHAQRPGIGPKKVAVDRFDSRSRETPAPSQSLNENPTIGPSGQHVVAEVVGPRAALVHGISAR